jgi:hypothetical protein
LPSAGEDERAGERRRVREEKKLIKKIKVGKRKNNKIRVKNNI